MCRGSASGWLRLTLISRSFSEPTRAPSVREALEVDFALTPCRLSHGDHVDVIALLGAWTRGTTFPRRSPKVTKRCSPSVKRSSSYVYVTPWNTSSASSRSIPCFLRCMRCIRACQVNIAKCVCTNRIFVKKKGLLRQSRRVSPGEAWTAWHETLSTEGEGVTFDPPLHRSVEDVGRRSRAKSGTQGFGRRAEGHPSGDCAAWRGRATKAATSPSTSLSMCPSTGGHWGGPEQSWMSRQGKST